MVDGWNQEQNQNQGQNPVPFDVQPGPQDDVWTEKDQKEMKELSREPDGAYEGIVEGWKFFEAKEGRLPQYCINIRPVTGPEPREKWMSQSLWIKTMTKADIERLFHLPDKDTLMTAYKTKQLPDDMAKTVKGYILDRNMMDDFAKACGVSPVGKTISAFLNECTGARIRWNLKYTDKGFAAYSKFKPA